MEVMRKIAQDLHAVEAQRVFGAEGSEALDWLLTFLPVVLAALPPALIDNALTVVHPVGDDAIDAEVVVSVPISDIGGLPQLQQQHGPLALIKSGEKLCVALLEKVDIEELSSRAVVYSLDERGEVFLVGGKRLPVPNPLPGIRSVFILPTFDSLELALDDYRERMVKTCRCYVLQEAWNDEKRFLWANKPEWRMRRSLEQFLATTLEGYDEVLPEQNVNESKPVDIKVTWAQSSHVALIEIKWLGKSIKKDQKGISSPYGQARAQAGADQLAAYLTEFRVRNPSRVVAGYLVVIDGRRRGVSLDTKSLSAADGFYYQYAELSFDPNHAADRTDFRPPVRMFCEPIIDYVA